jgi:hypothetical protein
MPLRRLTLITATTISTFVLGITALSTAGSTSADSSKGADETFLDQLTSLGIAFPSAQVAVREGHQVCAKLAAGDSLVAATTDVVHQTDLMTDQTVRFVAASIEAYCPQTRIFTSPADAAPEVMFGDLAEHMRP